MTGTSHSRRVAGRFWRVLCCAATWAITLGTAVWLPAQQGGLDDATADYFRGLRARRLFRLSESYCRQRLAHDNLAPAIRGGLTLELSRTLSDHADCTVGPEQDELRRQAGAAIDELLARIPEIPRRPFLEYQRALVPAAAGEWRRWMAELQPHDSAYSAEALADLNDALSRLRALDGRIGALGRKPPGGLSALEFRSLAQHVRQQIGLTLINLIRVLPVDSAERHVALQETQPLLKSLTAAQEGDDFAWTTRVSLVAWARLSGNLSGALQEAQSLAKRDPPFEFADRLLAEQLRILASQRKHAEALQALDDRVAIGQPLPGELVVLRAQLLIGRGPGEESPGEVQRQIDEMADRLERTEGGVWSYRLQLVRERYRDDLRLGPELAELARSARAQYRQGRLDEAIALFEQSMESADRNGKPDLACEFGFTRASIEVHLQRWQAAADDLLALVRRFPNSELVAEAHLLAAFALGKRLDAEPSGAHRAAYLGLLAEHRAKFTDPTTTGEATWMLAELDEGERNESEAVARYREIPFEHPRAGAALAAMARCYEKLIDRRRGRNEPTPELEREAVATLQRSLPSAADASLALNRHQAEAAMRLARIQLRRRPPDYAAADRWLLRVLASPVPSEPESQPPTSPIDSPAVPSPQVLTQALQLRIVSLAGQGKYVEARRQLERSAQGTPADTLRILEGLSPLTASDADDPLHDLGNLQLETALRLAENREALSAADQRRLDECLAQGYTAAGQSRRGIEIYESLLEKSPRDRKLLATLARLLGRSNDATTRQKAVDVWKKIESFSKPGSDDWLAARYEVCAGLAARGQQRDACKLLKVTRLLYPKLGGDDLRQKFAELEANCAAN